MKQFEELYHIHRLDDQNAEWKIGALFDIKKEEDNDFYKSLLLAEESVIFKCKDYDIDYAIAILEKIKSKYTMNEVQFAQMNNLLRIFYLLRREEAMEIGRTLYHENAPSRLHSLFLTNRQDIPYWLSKLAPSNYQTFQLDLEGNLFESSDALFPKPNSTLENQIEQSKSYWQPLTLNRTLVKEYLFQGKVHVLEEIDKR